jgi:hypothetical protein
MGVFLGEISAKYLDNFLVSSSFLVILSKISFNLEASTRAAQTVDADAIDISRAIYLYLSTRCKVRGQQSTIIKHTEPLKLKQVVMLLTVDLTNGGTILRDRDRAQ